MTDNIKRIRIFTTKSKNVRCFGVSVLLTRTSNSVYGDGPCHYTKEFRENHDFFFPQTCDAIERIHDIPGISRTITRKHEINITIPPVYDWDEVQPQIVECMLETLFPGETDVEIEFVDRFPSMASEVNLALTQLKRLEQFYRQVNGMRSHPDFAKEAFSQKFADAEGNMCKLTGAANKAVSQAKFDEAVSLVTMACRLVMEEMHPHLNRLKELPYSREVPKLLELIADIAPSSEELEDEDSDD